MLFDGVLVTSVPLPRRRRRRRGRFFFVPQAFVRGSGAAARAAQPTSAPTSVAASTTAPRFRRLTRRFRSSIGVGGVGDAGGAGGGGIGVDVDGARYASSATFLGLRCRQILGRREDDIRFERRSRFGSSAARPVLMMWRFLMMPLRMVVDIPRVVQQMLHGILLLFDDQLRRGRGRRVRRLSL